MSGDAAVNVGPSRIHGTGVFASRAFSKDEMILKIDDSRVVDEEHPLRSELGEFSYHCDYLQNGKVVLMPSPERNINSSCDPNVYVKTIEGTRYVVARRYIAAGDEITSDYIIDCHGGEVWECTCGSSKCRGTIVSSFIELPIELQLEYLPFLNPWFIEEHREKIDELHSRFETRRKQDFQ
jgi:uncharacterized protein